MFERLPQSPAEPAAKADKELSELSEEQRAVYLQIPEQVGYVHDDSFETGQAEDELYGEFELDLTGREPTRKEEVWLFRRFNYSRYRLALLIEAQQRRQSVHRAAEMVVWQIRVTEAREALTNIETLGQLTSEELDTYGRIPEKLRFKPHPLFETAAAEEELFDGSVDQSARCVEVAVDLLTPEQEVSLFLRYNYARYRVAMLIEAQERRLSLARAREMIVWFDRALAARDQLVVANMALVISMSTRKQVIGVDHTDRVAEGNFVLMQCVDNFDVSRGFRFSTYACRAILRHFCQLASQATRYHHHHPVNFQPELERSDYDEKKNEWQEEYLVEAVKEVLKDNKAKLSDAQLFILKQRFGLGSEDAKKATLAEVGEMLDLTDERIRQLQWDAIGKIRHHLNVEYLDAPVATDAVIAS